MSIAYSQEKKEQVKFGDILRRFSVHVDENERLEINMGALRTKILTLFSLDPDSDLTLTYTDLEGDVVTLVDDNDLNDVMSQMLNPFRITVVLNGKRSRRSYARSSWSSTPMKSPNFQEDQLPVTNTGVAEILNSIPDPEPLHEALLKILLDLATKAASPLVAELVDCFSKIGESCKNQVSQTRVETETSTQNGGSESSMSPPEAIDPNSEAVCRRKQLFFQKFWRKMHGSTSGTMGKHISQVSASEDHAVPHPLPIPLPSRPEHNFPDTSNVPSFENKNKTEKADDGQFNYMSFSASICTTPNSGKLSTTGSDTTPVCDGMPSVHHPGVICDGCDAYPIIGPLFHSKVNKYYDLCSKCFVKMGKEADYVRIDHPFSYPLLPRKGSYDSVIRSRQCSPLPFLKTVSKPASSEFDLDSQFVMDVNIIDGTVMAPSTSFVKVWRMRNSGNFIWPQGTQLVWTGGDKFSDAVLVEIQIPGIGLPTGKELDIAVDFIAPKDPGSYVSKWKMALPTGQMFGQQIWVHIQVISVPLEVPFCESFQGFALNLPLASDGSKGPVKPVVDLSEPCSSNSMRLRKPLRETMVEQTLHQPLFHGASSSSVNMLAFSPSSSSYKRVEQILLEDLEMMGFKQVDLNKKVLRKNDNNLEATIDDLLGATEWDPVLEELEDMGFLDVEKNKRLLAKNKGSIMDVVMDLIVAEGSL